MFGQQSRGGGMFGKKVRTSLYSCQESQWDLKNLVHVHPNLKGLFQNIDTKHFSKAGKIKYFLQNWKVLSNDPAILEIVEGWKLPLVGRPQQVREPRSIHMSRIEQEVVDRGTNNAGKGSNKGSPTSTRRISVNNLCSSEKGRE